MTHLHEVARLHLLVVLVLHLLLADTRTHVETHTVRGPEVSYVCVGWLRVNGGMGGCVGVHGGGRAGVGTHLHQLIEVQGAAEGDLRVPRDGLGVYVCTCVRACGGNGGEERTSE